MVYASGVQYKAVFGDDVRLLLIGIPNGHVQENSLYIKAAENEEIEHVNLENFAELWKRLAICAKVALRTARRAAIRAV
jgi:hypothetical protein